MSIELLATHTGERGGKLPRVSKISLGGKECVCGDVYLGEDPGPACGWGVQSGSLHAGVHTCQQKGVV